MVKVIFKKVEQSELVAGIREGKYQIVPCFIDEDFIFSESGAKREYVVPIAYRVILGESDEGIEVSDDTLDVYEEMGADEFSKYVNKSLEVPYKLEPGKELLTSMYNEDIGKIINLDDVYVFLGGYKAYGATQLFFNEYLKELTERLDSNLYMFAVSPHEIFLIKESEDLSMEVLAKLGEYLFDKKNMKEPIEEFILNEINRVEKGNEYPKQVMSTDEDIDFEDFLDCMYESLPHDI